MDPAKMKVVDLRSELGALGLDTKGNKPALVERLRKALETMTGKAIHETTILDTSTEDADEPATPRRAGPAARTRRRSSSTRIASTPAKVTRPETPEPIDEEPKAASPEPEPKESSPEPEPEKEPTPEPEPQFNPQPVPAPVLAPEPVSKPQEKPQIQSESDMYDIDDDKSQSPPHVVKNDVDEPMEDEETPSADGEKASGVQKDVEKMEEDGDNKDSKNEGGEDENEEMGPHELTEEEEWEQLNERLQVKEQERLDREKRQAEEDAKRFEELSNDPVKLQRLKRKHEKKARWSNFYKAVEITNEVLTPPTEDLNKNKGKRQEAADSKMVEPEIDDNKVTLSWYDSDLNQYMEAPELVSVVPLSEGAFAHAWAGTRATHGVGPESGRVCYEVRVGDAVTTTETTEKEVITNALRVGWSTVDSTLHLGEGELSFGYESSGRAVHNGEFKEYGKAFSEKDVIGVYLDLDSTPCKISYTHNGVELGVAYEFERSALGDKALFPHVLTKNLCYRVNFGNDQYNMLTKTKIVRRRLEIPIEQVLEEKRLREEEIQREREEIARRENERREKERKEREERQKKKKEEREKQERERKEKEAQEKKDRGEEAAGEAQKDADKEAAAEGAAPAAQPDEPKENGDAPQDAEVKEEPAEAAEAPAPAAAPEQTAPEPEAQPAADEKADVKEEPEGEVPEMTEEQVLKGHILDKRIKFVTRYIVEQELDGPEACLLPGYVLFAHAALVAGPRRPAARADCEVILMVGMPGAGKTHWAREHVAAHPERRYNVLSTAALFDRMQVDCKPFRAACEGRWDAMLSKGAKCVLKLLEFAHGRRRNYILDQTNVYPSAQRRKLREFDGYRRVAVAVVPAPEAYEERRGRRERADGKELPDGAVVDMKANFALPERCAWLDEVLYPELPEAEARAAVEQLHKEARAAGAVKERERRDRSASRDRAPKRPREPERRHPRDERRKDFGRDREDRWGGGGGGGGGGNSRWGPAGRGAGPGRWGPRERPAPPPGRFDRPWGARDNNLGGGGGGGGGFGRERDGFRGGRGGGPPRDRAPPARPDQRFGARPERARPPMDKRPPPHQDGGGWQRGGPAGARGRGAGPGAMARAPPGKEGGAAASQWGQWGPGWGNWNNWNQQNQANWNNWGNWNNWNNAQQGQQGQQSQPGQAVQPAGAAAGTKGQGQGQQATQQQWQQWYQWQQWQQQQGWPGYGQQGAAGAGAAAQDPQAWAQYYQNYNANAAANSAAGDKK